MFYVILQSAYDSILSVFVHCYIFICVLMQYIPSNMTQPLLYMYVTCLFPFCKLMQL